MAFSVILWGTNLIAQQGQATFEIQTVRVNTVNTNAYAALGDVLMVHGTVTYSNPTMLPVVIITQARWWAMEANPDTLTYTEFPQVVDSGQTYSVPLGSLFDVESLYDSHVFTVMFEQLIVDESFGISGGQSAWFEGIIW